MTWVPWPSVLSKVVRSDSWRATSAVNAASSAPVSSAPPQYDRHRRGVLGAVGVELVQEPQALLGERQW
jgi:hypothetical protein